MNKYFITLAVACGLCQVLPAREADVHKVKTAYDYLIAMQNRPKPLPQPKIKKVKKKKDKDLQNPPTFVPIKHIDWSVYAVDEMKSIWTTFIVEDEDPRLNHPLTTKLTYGDIQNLVFELFCRLEEK